MQPSVNAGDSVAQTGLLALQALAAELLVQTDLGPGVHAVPSELDRQVAALKLAALGVAIDTLTGDQEAYLNSWMPRP